MKKKEIVWFYPHLKFWMGGNRFLYEVAKRLTKRYRLTIITNLGKREFIDKFKKSGVEVKTILPFCSNDIIYWLFFPLFLFLEIIKSIKYAKKADYLFATLFPSNFVAYVLAKIFKKRYIFYCYEPYPFFHNETYMKSTGLINFLIMKTLSIFYKWLDIMAVKNSDKVFTLNQLTQEATKNVYGVNSIITYMGVDTNFFRPYKNKKLEVKYKNKLLIYHSTDYTPTKRTDLAIEYIKGIKIKYPKIQLIITSTQPNNPRKKIYQNIIKKFKLEKNVKLLGLVSDDELKWLYSNSICYISCSKDKNMGTTSSNLPVKEAMASQIPVIRANITNEDVENEVSGFLVDPENVEEVIKKIEFLIKNPKIRIRMGKAARRKIINFYNWKKVTSIIINSLN